MIFFSKRLKLELYVKYLEHKKLQIRNLVSI